MTTLSHVLLRTWKERMFQEESQVRRAGLSQAGTEKLNGLSMENIDNRYDRRYLPFPSHFIRQALNNNDNYMLQDSESALKAQHFPAHVRETLPVRCPSSLHDSPSLLYKCQERRRGESSVRRGKREDGSLAVRGPPQLQTDRRVKPER